MAAAAYTYASYDDSDDSPDPPNLLEGPKLVATLTNQHGPAIAAKSLARSASEILSEYLIGKRNMAMIYLSHNPYFDSFKELVDISRFDLKKHRTAGLCLAAMD
jgi:hypothetical protein